jgi:hypothetical protein
MLAYFTGLESVSQAMREAAQENETVLEAGRLVVQIPRGEGAPTASRRLSAYLVEGALAATLGTESRFRAFLACSTKVQRLYEPFGFARNPGAGLFKACGQDSVWMSLRSTALTRALNAKLVPLALECAEHGCITTSLK